jgi:hypothetical protein
VLRRLASSRVRHLVLGLVLVTFLPVASATVACQIACTAMVAATSHHSSHGGSTPTKAHDVGRLAHAGPCHLASMPTLCSDAVRSLDVVGLLSLRPTAYPLPASFVGPPPEHKPRA